MGDLFQKIIEMSLMGSVVILITVLARFILRKRSKRFIMILWAVVAMRLLLPVSIESELSIFNYLPRMTQTDVEVAAVQEAAVPDIVDTRTVTTDAVSHHVQNGIRNVVAADNAETVIPEETAVSTKELPDITTVLAIVWLTGTAVITGYCSVRYISLKRKLKDANRIEKNIYESEKVKAPFVFGFFVPKIYLPDVLDNNEREYILRHERTHIKHGDWISKIIGMTVVAVHWFNPLVWIAYILFERDIEMSCDESVVANMDTEVKQAYTMSLVTYAKRSNNKRYLVTPLGFSKNSFSKTEVTNRVKNIINFKEGHKITAIIITLALFMVGAACSLDSEDKTKDTTEVSESIEISVEVAESDTVSEVAVSDTLTSMPLSASASAPAPSDSASDTDVDADTASADDSENIAEPDANKELEVNTPDPTTGTEETTQPVTDSGSASENDIKEKTISKTVYPGGDVPGATPVSVRTGPGDDYEFVGYYYRNESINVVAITDNGWYRTDSDCYVFAGDCSDEPDPEINPSVTDFVTYVKSFIGCPYVYAGASPSGFDTSGFVMYCYAEYYSICLPHGANSISCCGEEVAPDDIQAGDIICFDKDGDGVMEHCGIYVGNDTYVHAQPASSSVVESCYSADMWKIGTVRRLVV